MKKQLGFIGVYLIMAVGLLAQSPGEAINFTENPDGVGLRALSMGNAYTAAANDWSALYWNPAALTAVERSEISGAMYHTQFRNNADFMGNAEMRDQTFTQFKSFGLAYRFPTVRGSFVLALGRHNYKDFDDYLSFSGFNAISNGLEFDLGEDQAEYYQFDQDVWQTEEILQSGHLGAWSFGGGLALSPHLNIGLTAHAWAGNNDYTFRFMQQDVDDYYRAYPANYHEYEMTQKIESKYSGFGLTLGSLLNVNDELKIGVAIDFPKRLKVSETYASSDLLVFDDGYESEMDLGTGQWEYFVAYPMKISGGVTIDTETLLLTADASYCDWTETRFQKPERYAWDDDYDSLIEENIFFKSEFRPVLSYGAGGELKFTGPNVRIRGGYRVVPSPVAGAEKDLDRQYITAGLGYNLDHVTTLNVTYVRGWWTRWSEDGYTPGGTKEVIETDRILAGITYRF